MENAAGRLPSPALVGQRVAACRHIAADAPVGDGFIPVKHGYLLAQRRVPASGLVQAIVDLPLAVPHTVAGIALLFLLGRTGWVGAPAGHLGISFYGSQWGIVAAMLFVSAPFAVNAARVAFESIDPNLERAARSLGATRSYAFWRVTLALGARGVLTGASMRARSPSSEPS